MALSTCLWVFSKKYENNVPLIIHDGEHRTTTMRIKKKSKFRFTDKSYDNESNSYGDQTSSERDDWELLSDFVDSKLISDSSNDTWIPKVVIITRIWMLFRIYKTRQMWKLKQTFSNFFHHREVFKKRTCSAKNFCAV